VERTTGSFPSAFRGNVAIGRYLALTVAMYYTCASAVYVAAVLCLLVRVKASTADWND